MAALSVDRSAQDYRGEQQGSFQRLGADKAPLWYDRKKLMSLEHALLNLNDPWLIKSRSRFPILNEIKEAVLVSDGYIMRACHVLV